MVVLLVCLETGIAESLKYTQWEDFMRETVHLLQAFLSFPLKWN